MSEIFKNQFFLAMLSITLSFSRNYYTHSKKDTLLQVSFCFYYMNFK